MSEIEKLIAVMLAASTADDENAGNSAAIKLVGALLGDIRRIADAIEIIAARQP
jgi:hypothetical protein